MNVSHEEIPHGVYTEILLPDLSLTVRTLGTFGLGPPSVRPIELDEPSVEPLNQQASLFMQSMRGWLSEHGRLQRHGVLPKDDEHMFDYLSQLHNAVAEAFPRNPLSQDAPVRLGNAVRSYRRHCPDDKHPRTDQALQALYEQYLSDALYFKRLGFNDVDRLAIKYDPKMYTKLLQSYEGHEYICPSDVRYVFKNLSPKPSATLREMANTMEYIEQVFIPKLQAETGYRHEIPRQQIRRLTWNADPLTGVKDIFFRYKHEPVPLVEATDLATELEITKGTAYRVLLEELIRTLKTVPDYRMNYIATLDRYAIEAVLCSYPNGYRQKIADALAVEDLDTYVLREAVPHYFYKQHRHRQTG
jgi:hypothetical protein